MQPLIAGARSFTGPETYPKQIPDWCAPSVCAVGATCKGDEVTV